ncbi:MAG: TonB-dependent receptor [Bacteroidales bacterium]|nr:TonB-dependent receptor [Candidatus Liminaster caballi]
MKHLILLLAGLSLQTLCLAGIVKGKVADDKKQPLEFVNVALYEQGSATPYKGTISDENGSFSIEGVKDGTFTVRLTFMGYTEQTRNVTLSANNQHTANLRTITMTEDQAVLQEVSVSTQKAAMRLDIDKKVFDVSQNITTAGLSASEALENIPSVEVDQEGNISLRGSESVTIWINGKAQGLTSDNRGDILQQLPAESIERVEVITNPSSKYSPEGSAGIINIILKRDRKAGYYGGVQLNGGKTQGADPNGRVGANINYSSGTLEAYANVGVGRRVRVGHGFSDRDYVDVNDGYHYGFLSNKYNNDGSNTNFFGRAGLTWHFTEKDEIGVNYMGMVGIGNGERNSHNVYDQDLYVDEAGQWMNYNTQFMPYRSERWSYNSDKPHMNNVSLTYRHEWKTNHTLDFSVSHNTWNGTGETGYTQKTTQRPLLSDGTYLEKTETVSKQWQEFDMNNKGWEVQLDYVQPLGGSAKMEAGYKGNFRHENSPTETWTDESKSTSIYTLFNRFIYDTDIHAAYFNYQNRIGARFGYQLGLRGEYWTVNTESYNYDQEYGTSNMPAGYEPVPAYEKSFFKIFPTVFLSYQLRHEQELQLNYTRRLQRPWGGQMNSFKNISDSTAISYGNPELTPAYTNSFELNYLKNWDEHTLSISTYYRPSSDVIQHVSYLQDGIRYSTHENVAKELSSGIEIIGKNKLFKILDLTTTVNAFYYKLDGGTFNINDQGMKHQVYVPSDDDFSWNASLMAQVTLPWQLAFQATGRYNAAKVITQGKRDANYSLDLGLRRSFFDKRLTVNLNGRNVLNSRKFRSHTSAAGYTMLSEGVWGGRRIGMQISWSFGNMRPKMKGGRRPDGGEGGMDEGGNDGGGMSGGFGGEE